MEVTDVRIRKITDDGKMRGIVSVTFDNAFVVHDIKIIDGQNGLFIAMPSRKVAEGEFRDIAHPINSDTRKLIQDQVLDAYKEELENGNNEPSNETVEEQI
ncbi:MAG: septation regulator SpoVG [Peptostreptococcaceae bacterium]|nr:septation regulator SpoVG [Peptostreptococcaceae bacterium]